MRMLFRKRVIRSLVFAAFIIGIVPGVVGGFAPSEIVALNKKVPFFPQENYQYGPSSLAGVLNYWGIESSPGTIAREIYSGSAKGALNLEMVLYAWKKGLHATRSNGNIRYLKENIDLGYPVIVLVDNGFWVYQQNHFMVIVGYNKNGVLVNSGGKGFKFIPQEDFLKSWERADYWTLLIGPQR